MESTPLKEHAWLEQLLGEWDGHSECIMKPGEPPLKADMTESVRRLGDFWILAEGSGTTAGGSPANVLMTLGFDPGKGKFVGTWVGSMMPMMWVYEGTLDASGRKLTLTTQGPMMGGETCVSVPASTAAMTTYEDIIEIVSPDLRMLRSRVQMPDGTWNEFMQAEYRRKG